MPGAPRPRAFSSTQAAAPCCGATPPCGESQRPTRLAAAAAAAQALVWTRATLGTPARLRRSPRKSSRGAGGATRWAAHLRGGHFCFFPFVSFLFHLVFQQVARGPVPGDAVGGSGGWASEFIMLRVPREFVAVVASSLPGAASHEPKASAPPPQLLPMPPPHTQLPTATCVERGSEVVKAGDSAFTARVALNEERRRVEGQVLDYAAFEVCCSI